MPALQPLPDRSAKDSDHEGDNDTPPPSATEKSMSWKPTINRQQSTNEQDLKRMYQERLLYTEKGKEAGFSSGDDGGRAERTH